MKQKVGDFIKSSCHVVVICGAHIHISYQCDVLALSSLPSPPSDLIRSTCCSNLYEPDPRVPWQCHSLAKLASSDPSLSFLAAGRLVAGG